MCTVHLSMLYPFWRKLRRCHLNLVFTLDSCGPCCWQTHVSSDTLVAGKSPFSINRRSQLNVLVTNTHTNHYQSPAFDIIVHRERGSCSCQLSLLKGNSSGGVGADRIPTSGSQRFLNPTADCFTGCDLVLNSTSFNKSSSSFLLVKVYAIDPSNEFLIQSRIFSATSRNIRVAGFMAACSVCRPVKAS